MRITIESTDMVTLVGNVPARLWRGRTERGVECLVFVHRIAVRRDADTAEFDRELHEQLPPGQHMALPEILATALRGEV
jgi:hypothetical protein